MSDFEPMRPDCRIEGFYTTGTQKKVDCFNADAFCGHCNTVFETWVVFIILVVVKTQDMP